MPDPSVDDLFGSGAATTTPPGASTGLPTVGQLFSTPQSGAAHDSVWSSLQNAGARVLDAAGFGATSAWGGRPLGLSPDDEQKLRSAGVFNDYENGHTSFMKSANEAVIRPFASLADLAVNAIPAVAGGFTEAARQASAELGGESPEAIHQLMPEEQRQAQVRGLVVSAATGGVVQPSTLEATAELASGVTKGYYPELAEEGVAGGNITAAAARSARISDAVAARAVGALGEGEAGFYEATPLTPENATARTEAAKEAGIDPVPQPPPPAPDVHELARRIDPETFQEYDSLNAESALHRATLASLGAERAALPEVAAAQGQIDTILGRVNNVPSRLTNAARSRLEAAQGQLDDLLHTDTPEMAAARASLLDADYAMRELAPDVSEAYRRAREIAPDIPEETPVATQAPGAPEAEKQGAQAPAAEMAAVSEGQAKATAAAGTAAGAPPEGGTPNVVGEQTLGEPQAQGGGRAGTGFNGLRDRQGNPIRFKNDQQWAPGQRVNVGFMKGLTVQGLQTANEEHEASFILSNDKGQVYAFTPQKGLYRLEDADAAAALQEVAPKAEEAAAAEPARPVTEPANPLRQAAADVDEHRGPSPPRTTIMQAIKNNGGLKLKDEEGRATPGPDVQGALADVKKKPPGTINNATGLTPERMHEALKEQGWFGSGEVSDDALVKAIEKQASGEDVFHPDSGLKEAHERRGVLDEEMSKAGVTKADSAAQATAKLHEWREMQAKQAAEMPALQHRADALGIPHTPHTTFDELLADVAEREAIQNEADPYDYDSYEQYIDAGLTADERAELDRESAEGLTAEHGEGEGAVGVPPEREGPAGPTAGATEPAQGAGGGGDGAAGIAEPSASLTPVAGTGETLTRGLAQHAEETAIAHGITQGFGDLPEYERVSMADQARQTADLIAADYAAAKEIAMGERAPPHGLLPESVFVGVEKRALAEGDVETLRDLATKSRLTTAATTMGQRIRTLGERDSSSPVGAIRAVQAAREAAVGDVERAKAAVASDIKGEIAKAASDEGAWASFARSLEC